MRFTTTLLLLAGTACYGQQNITATGNDISSSSGSISYSVGQIDYISAENGTNSVNLGVQQPIEFYAVDVEEMELLGMTIFPNPANSHLTINCTNCSEQTTFSIFDVNGKEVLTIEQTQPSTTVNIEQLSAGSYSITENGKSHSLLKFIKL